MTHPGMMIPAEICRAALCEAGRPDLARNIGTNRRGQPIRAWTAYYGSDANLVAKAFALTYGARLEPTSEADVAAMLRQEIEPWDLVPRHWSPKHGQWRDYFNPYEWIELAERSEATDIRLGRPACTRYRIEARP